MADIRQQLASHGETLTFEDQKRVRQMMGAVDAYWGRLPKEITVKPGKPDDNIQVNYSRLFVDKKAAFLFGRGVEFELDKSKTTAEEEWLDDIWRRVRKQTFLHTCAVNGGIYGMCFIKMVLPDGYDPPRSQSALSQALKQAEKSREQREQRDGPGQADQPEEPEPVKTRPTPASPHLDAHQVRLIVLDPTAVKVTWRTDDIDQVDEYVVLSTGERMLPNGKKRTVLKRQRIVAQRPDAETTNRRAPTHWTITDEERMLAGYEVTGSFGNQVARAQRRSGAPNWFTHLLGMGQLSEPDASGSQRWETVSEEIWPWEFPPIVHCQNLPVPNEFWGLSELEDDHIQIQRKLNFAWSTLMKIWRYHGFPVVWGRGFNAKQVQRDVDEVLILQAPDATLSTLPASAPSPGLDIIKHLTTVLHMIGKIPQLALGDPMSTGGLQYSGVALRLAYAPMLEANRLKQDLYGEMLEHLCARLLVIGGWRSAAEYHRINVECVWPDPLPTDEAAERANAAADDQLGIASKDTLARKLGYDYEIEQAKRKHEAEQNTPPQLQQGEQDGEQKPERVQPGQAKQNQQREQPEEQRGQEQPVTQSETSAPKQVRVRKAV